MITRLPTALHRACLTGACLAAASGASASAQQIKHVFVISMENHNWVQPATQTSPQQIFGNSSAPYINSLVTPGNANAAQTSYASNYHNVSGVHPSEPNYIWSEAGTKFGVANDNPPYGTGGNNQTTTSHFTTLLNAAGHTWKSYQEDIDTDAAGNVLPSKQWVSPIVAHSGTYTTVTNPYNGSLKFNYQPKHNPPIFFSDSNGGNDATPSNPAAHLYAPLQQLQADLNNNATADYNWITPNMNNDMHDALSGGYKGLTGDSAAIKQGDDFLASVVPMIKASAAYQDGGMIVIWFDETEGGDDSLRTIGEIVISPLAKGNAYNSTVSYTHSSDLKTMQEIFQAGAFLGDAASAGTNDLADMLVPGAIPTGSDEVAWWRFDEGSGTSASDSTGNGHTGTLVGSPAWTSGFANTALAFNGTSSHVDFGTGASLGGTVPFTTSAWVKTTSVSNSPVIIQQRCTADGTTNGYIGEYKVTLTTAGKVNFMLYGSGGYQFNFSGTKTINDGNWHNVAVVRDGGTGSIYVDGLLDTQASGTVRALDPTIRVSIGADVRDSVGYFNGGIDEVRIWSVALTPGEIASQAGESALWAFDEGTGTTVGDSTFNGRIGTIAGGTTWTTSGKYGNALVFGGFSGHVDFGTSPALTGTTPFTVSAWVKTTTVSNSPVIIQQRCTADGTTNGYLGEYKVSLTTAGKVNFMLYGSGGYQFNFSGAVGVSDGLWHHVVVVRDGGSGSIYVDGLLDTQTSGTIRSLDPTIRVSIGADVRDNVGFFNGSIDQVSIWQYALSAGQVSQLP